MRLSVFRQYDSYVLFSMTRATCASLFIERNLFCYAVQSVFAFQRVQNMKQIHPISKDNTINSLVLGYRRINIKRRKKNKKTVFKQLISTFVIREKQPQKHTFFLIFEMLSFIELDIYIRQVS